MAALMKFDTLTWAKKLEKAGVPPQQAEVQVELIFRAIDDNICTKQDLKELESNSKQNLRELEGNVKVNLKELELKIEEVRKDLSVSIERIHGSIEKVKGSVNKQIARWALGVSALQATVIIGVLRHLH